MNTKDLIRLGFQNRSRIRLPKYLHLAESQQSRRCGRYRRTTQEEELARIYHIPIPKQTDLPISYNIAPSQKVLTIRFNPETQQRSLDALQWGLIPYWTKDPKMAPTPSE
jgi:putative SOS response-associated peptidase YedK